MVERFYVSPVPVRLSLCHGGGFKVIFVSLQGLGVLLSLTALKGTLLNAILNAVFFH